MAVILYSTKFSLTEIKRKERVGGGEGGEKGLKGDRDRGRLRGKNCFNFYHAGQCNIQYEQMAVLYGRVASLSCPSSFSASVRWWRSTEQCSSFIDYSSQCSSTSCQVGTNSSYFYYCCTPSTVSDVLVARDDKRRCFRIQGWCSFWTVAS